MRPVALALALAAIGCGGPAQDARGGVDDTAAALDPHRPVDLSLERPDGTRVDLAAFRGRAVLVVAFRMDDLPSNATVRDAERLAREYPDDLTVVALSGDEQPPARLRSLLEVFGRVLDLRASIVTVADDAVREGASPLGAIDRIPTIWLVNRAGLVARREVNVLRYDELAALVAPALPPGVQPRRETAHEPSDPSADPARSP